MGLTDVDILFAHRGDEQVVVTMPIVLVKTLAQQLTEAIRFEEKRRVSGNKDARIFSGANERGVRINEGMSEGASAT